MRGAAGKPGELDDLSPVSRWDNADDGGRFFHLLIRPESPPDIIVFQGLHELRDPVVGVLPGFTHPDRHIILFPKVDVLSYHAFIWSRPVFVEGVGDVRVKGLAEDREVAVPLRTPE